MESCGQDDSVGPTAYSGDTVCREPDDAVIRGPSGCCDKGWYSWNCLEMEAIVRILCYSPNKSDQLKNRVAAMILWCI